MEKTAAVVGAEAGDKGTALRNVFVDDYGYCTKLAAWGPVNLLLYEANSALDSAIERLAEDSFDGTAS